MLSQYEFCKLCGCKLGWTKTLNIDNQINGLWYCPPCAKRKRKQNRHDKGAIAKSTMAGKILIVRK